MRRKRFKKSGPWQNIIFLLLLSSFMNTCSSFPTCSSVHFHFLMSLYVVKVNQTLNLKRSNVNRCRAKFNFRNFPASKASQTHGNYKWHNSIFPHTPPILLASMSISYLKPSCDLLYFSCMFTASLLVSPTSLLGWVPNSYPISDLIPTGLLIISVNCKQ